MVDYVLIVGSILAILFTYRCLEAICGCWLFNQRPEPLLHVTNHHIIPILHCRIKRYLWDLFVISSFMILFLLFSISYVAPLSFLSILGYRVSTLIGLAFFILFTRFLLLACVFFVFFLNFFLFSFK